MFDCRRAASGLTVARSMSTGTRIKDLPKSQRPRERLAEHGPDALKIEELIAILLRTGREGVSAIDVARQLYEKFGSSLKNLARASVQELSQIKGVGRDKAVTLKSAFTLASRMAEELRPEAPLLDTPERVAEHMADRFRDCGVEHFHAVLLNTRRRLIRVERLAEGTMDTLLVHPREVFKSAILSDAAGLVLVHNHPSGDPTPSEADIKVTRDLIRVGQLLKIDVLDHVIIGRATEERRRPYASLRELGYFYA
jgi:DNA repair protein RadC